MTNHNAALRTPADPDEGQQTIYRTSAHYVAASPMGLLPACGRVEHRCTRCHERVGPDQLIEHARQHEGEVMADD